MVTKRHESRIEELQAKLQQESKEKSDTIRAAKSADKTVRDVQFQLAESERQRARQEDDLRKAEMRVDAMKQALTELVSPVGKRYEERYLTTITSKTLTVSYN